MKINRSQIIALIAILLVVGWFALNSLGNSDAPPTSQPAANSQTDPEKLPEVVVKWHEAEDHLRQISIFGRTEAMREVVLKAETTGIVTSAPLTEGQFVKKGQLVCRQDINARQANLDQAKAMLKTRELEYRAAVTLVEKGYRSETQAATALAALDGAKAQVKQAEIELDNVNIRAPFSGIFETQLAQIGDFLSPGQPCGLIVDLDPLIAVVQMTENQIGYVSVGQETVVQLATGQTLAGKIRLIEAKADPSTRTFRTEILLPNPKLELKAGLTATVRLQGNSVPAHKIPSQILSLNEFGDLGVRYLDANDIVRFAVTETVDEDSDGIWVTGLPEKARIIIKGQDFVSVGTIVDPREGAPRSISQ